jgi:hypothetical protein
VVVGHSAGHAHVWGHLEGEIPLTLTDGAGDPLTVLDIDVVSWPRF